MLIGFIALIALVNYLFEVVFGISFQQVLGYVFYPLAWLIGIPASEAMQAGSIMATKLVTNEFVAMIDMSKMVKEGPCRLIPLECCRCSWCLLPTSVQLE